VNARHHRCLSRPCLSAAAVAASACCFELGPGQRQARRNIHCCFAPVVSSVPAGRKTVEASPFGLPLAKHF